MFFSAMHIKLKHKLVRLLAACCSRQLHRILLPNYCLSCIRLSKTSSLQAFTLEMAATLSAETGNYERVTRRVSFSPKLHIELQPRNLKTRIIQSCFIPCFTFSPRCYSLYFTIDVLLIGLSLLLFLKLCADCY
jgi:hypothetical protein